ncbi:muscarinic acetylcholine receptor M3-like [Dysidea avara]|uniref:muscarinic acetylcholine receptor M3-like n=1 Tax=Dysidea avara TaxID=196820 RepID=UPI00331855F3
MDLFNETKENNATNGTTTEEMEEHLLVDLILPMLTWTLMGIAEILFAALVIVAIVKARELRRMQYFFIANLMICDIGSSITVNFLVTCTVINSLINENSKGVSCKAIDFLYFPFTASFLMVTVVIFDRFLHIKEPFRYREIMTKKLAVALVALSWIIAMLLCLFSLFDPQHQGQYTRNGFCSTTTLLSRVLAIILPNTVATAFAVALVIWMVWKAQKAANYGQSQQGYVINRKALMTLILLAGTAGLLGVLVPILLGVTRLTVGNETVSARFVQNVIVPIFGKAPTMAHALLYGFHLTEIRKNILKMIKCCKN